MRLSSSILRALTVCRVFLVTIGIRLMKPSEVSKLQGHDALGFALGLLVQRTEAMLKSMPAMLEATGVDALIIDPIQFYAELAPMNLGVPYIHAAVAAHCDYSGYTPLCIYGDRHQATLSDRDSQKPERGGQVCQNASYYYGIWSRREPDAFR
jgi:hypothetical protein